MDSNNESDKQKESPTEVELLGVAVKEHVRVILICPCCKEKVRLCIDPSTAALVPEPKSEDLPNPL